MNQWQCPVCNSSKITVIGEGLTCLACGHQEYLYDYRNAYDEPILILQEPHTEISTLEDRVGNLEAISGQPGRIPRRYYDEFQQIRGEVANLRNKVYELSTKKKHLVKSTYKGLVVG